VNAELTGPLKKYLAINAPTALKITKGPCELYRQVARAWVVVRVLPPLVLARCTFELYLALPTRPAIRNWPSC